MTAGKANASIAPSTPEFSSRTTSSFPPHLTFSYGLRYEAQNWISDHNDWAPRVSLAWAPAGAKSTPAKTVIRAGYGWFFDRFSSNYALKPSGRTA